MSENPNLPADESFWDNLEEAASAADSGGAQFGQLTIKPASYIHWKKEKDEDGQIRTSKVEVTPADFANLPARQKSIELLFVIDVKGMNPDLDWTYDRRVRPGDKDWHRILKPSVIALLGPDSMKQGEYSKTLQSLSGKYVEAADVPQTKDPEYNTISLVRIFESKEECFAAYKERFGDDSVSTGAPSGMPLSTPDGWETGVWLSTVSDVESALVGGKSIKEVADDYGVAVSHIAEIKAQIPS